MAKARRKAGRPRKIDVKREPNGQARRDPILRVAGEAEHVLRRRCSYMGWPVTADTIKRAKDRRLGTLHGCMMMAGFDEATKSLSISEAAYLGVDAYAATLDRYRRSIGAPSPHARAATLDRVDASSAIDIADASDRVRRHTAAYMAAYSALKIAVQDTSAVTDCIEDRIQAQTLAEAVAILGDRRASLEIAGLALAAHYGLTA